LTSEGVLSDNFGFNSGIPELTTYPDVTPYGIIPQANNRLKVYPEVFGGLLCNVADTIIDEEGIQLALNIFPFSDSIALNIGSAFDIVRNPSLYCPSAPCGPFDQTQFLKTDTQAVRDIRKPFDRSCGQLLTCLASGNKPLDMCLRGYGVSFRGLAKSNLWTLCVFSGA